VTAFLADLHRHPAPGVAPLLDGPGLADLLAVVEEWYLPAAGATRGEFRLVPALVSRLYTAWNDARPVLSLRDFHAGNVIWLETRQGVSRVGLLDVQDAVATHPAYDLVSLLQDARRDLSPGLEQGMVRHYLGMTRADPAEFSAVYALLGVQRGLRILGVFARLALAGQKPGYLRFVPRVWRLIAANLEHPELAGLRDAVRAGVPPPEASRLEGLMRHAPT
jgi:aminoglycoside/choline kinase family phosphotransferase